MNSFASGSPLCPTAVESSISALVPDSVVVIAVMPAVVVLVAVVATMVVLAVAAVVPAATGVMPTIVVSAMMVLSIMVPTMVVLVAVVPTVTVLCTMVSPMMVPMATADVLVAAALVLFIAVVPIMVMPVAVVPATIVVPACVRLCRSISRRVIDAYKLAPATMLVACSTCHETAATDADANDEPYPPANAPTAGVVVTIVAIASRLHSIVDAFAHRSTHIPTGATAGSYSHPIRAAYACVALECPRALTRSTALVTPARVRVTFQGALSRL